MKKIYAPLLVIILLTIIIVSKSFAQGVGINSTGAAPHADALLHVDIGASTTKGFLVTGNSVGYSSVPNLGSGQRLMFYPGKSAFRVGVVYGTQWDDVNVGNASIAIGENTIASGTRSTAMGELTVASGFNSTAMGGFTTASGGYSTAMGVSTTASGLYSFAAGTRVSTNNHSGAFFFGDGDPYNKGVRSIGFNNQFAARFNGGYYFISSDAGADIGVQVLAGGNSWVSMSDENRKENFAPLNGEDVLQKIKDIKFSSWNYKTQDPKVHRHYGIMAQDFYKAFGNDKYGRIGNDTTVNPIDMLGIDMAAIQELEKRTALLSQENKDLKDEMAELKLIVARLEKH